MDLPPPPLLLVLLILPVLCLASPITISITPKALPASGSLAHIHWSGFSPPTPFDWVGIYSPPDSSDKNFIGYLFLSTSPTHLASGSGNLSLPLVNLRAPYQFRLFQCSKDEMDPKHHDHEHNPLPGTKRKVAVSGYVGFEVMSRPEQVHLAFTEREDEMRVMFVTGGRKGRTWVEYGLDEGRLEGRVEAEVDTYGRKDMCGWPANTSLGWRDPGLVHDAVIKGLEKGKRYYYRVGNDEGGWSPLHSFISRNNNLGETIAFLFGDMGTHAPYSTFRRTQVESESTVKWILRDIEELGDKSSFVSHIGDISYARGYSWLWDEFFNQIEPIASRIPYHVSIGNHEYDWPQQPWRPNWSYSSYNKDGGGECGVPYSIKFHMPGNSSLPTGMAAPNTRNLHYSFDAGVVHFLYISTETDFLPGSAQHNFIKHDLENVNRDKTPFIVVQGHRPMYTTSNEVRDAQLRGKMLESLEPLLVENRVTLALWGHVHRYERLCPLKNFTCMGNSSESNLEKSTIHVVIGMAGQEWQPIWEPTRKHPELPIFPQPKRSMYRGGEFGYTRLVATREKLTLTYVGNHDGQAHDSVEILSGKSSGDQISPPEEEGNQKDQTKVAEVFTFPAYLKYVGVLILGALGGYALGFFVRGRNDNGVPKTEWTPVKMDEL